MKPRLLLTTLTFSLQSLAQGYSTVGARSAALANSSVCLEDVWAFHNNPGALATIRHATAGIYYESRFTLKELQTQAFATAIPLKVGVLSVGAQFFGYSQYRSTKAGIGYSMHLGERLSAGVQVNGQQLTIAGGYGSSLNATVEGGILAKISEKWTVGASVMNIGRQRIAQLEGDYYTTVMRVGATYLPSQKVRVCAEVGKQVTTSFSFRAGIEYMPTTKFCIRAGAQSGPTQLAFGASYKLGGFSIDLGSRYHSILGWTPNAGLNYQFGQHEK